MASSEPEVLGIAGSPRRDGNTDLLLQQAISGANSQGAHTRVIILSELNIAPCRHCDGCWETGVCVIQDDMQWLSYELRKVDYLILASPIFFMGVTAQVKAMIDRCQALWVMKYVLKLPVAINPHARRKGLLISAGSANFPELFQPAIATVKSWFTTLDVIYADDLLFPGVDKKGTIAHHPTALEQAFHAGQRLLQA